MNWITVDRLEEHWSEARVNAEIADGSTIELDTKNITGLTLNFAAGKTPLNRNTPITIRIDGSDISVAGPKSNLPWKVSFINVNNKWKRQSKERTPALAKKHGLQGPIDDAFMDSFIFVTPTGKEDSEELSSWVDSEIEDARIQWWRQFRGQARVKRDVDLTSDDIANNHLILWGDPSSNRILKRIKNSLPVDWSKGKFTIDGKSYNPAKEIPVLVYPNPLNPKRYIVLNSSFTFSEFSGGTNSLQIPKLPDWAVLDLSVPRSERIPNGVVNAGVFDEQWKYKSH